MPQDALGLAGFVSGARGSTVALPMNYRITHDETGWQQDRPRPQAGREFVRAFEVYMGSDQAPSGRVLVGMRGVVAAAQFPGAGTALNEPLLKDALAVYAIAIIAAAVDDGSLFSDEEPEGLVRTVAPNEARDLAATVSAKQCRYLQRSADDHCLAGYDARTQNTVPIATTSFMCRSCAVPDARIVCSALHHVSTWPKDAGVQPVAAMCAAGARTELQPLRCRPGDYECWHREGEDASRAPGPVPPLAIHESLDYFNAVWRIAFDAPLFKPFALATGGVLATPCKSSQDFQVKLSALGEVFNAFSVRLDAMKAKLAEWGSAKAATADEIADMEKAVSVLQRLLAIRAGQQHARERAETAARALGLHLPPASYGDAWNEVQTLLHDALGDLRRFIRQRG